MVNVYRLQSAEADAAALLDQLGLSGHLSAQSSNGLRAVVDHIRQEGREHLRQLKT